MTTPNEAVDTLVSIMTGSNYKLEMRIAAAEGLGFAGGHEARDALKKVVKSSNQKPELRIVAAKALGRAARQ
jgi:HEAT repeat protein